MSRSLRLLFAGTPEVAVPSLEALLASRHELVGVITRPDARVGRGRTTRPSPVRVAAEAAGLPVITPASLREPQVREQLRAWAPDGAAVVAYGGLVPKDLLDLPPLGWVNLHFSLLPAWRGAAPVQHALLAGDDVTGAVTFVLEEGLDTGPVLGRLTETVRPRDTSGDLLGRLSTAGAGLLAATFDGLADGELVAEPQPGDGVSHAPKLETADGRVDWDRPAFAIDRQVRATTPAPGAWTQWRGQRLKLLPLTPVDQEESGMRLAPGQVHATKAEVLVGTGTGAVRLGEVQPLGKKVMAAADWARGVRPEQGEHFDG